VPEHLLNAMDRPSPLKKTAPRLVAKIVKVQIYRVVSGNGIGAQMPIGLALLADAQPAPAGLTVREAGRLWGVSKTTAARRLAQGLIP